MCGSTEVGTGLDWIFVTGWAESVMAQIALRTCGSEMRNEAMGVLDRSLNPTRLTFAHFRWGTFCA